jgi:hypothetical protein
LSNHKQQYTTLAALTLGLLLAGALAGCGVRDRALPAAGASIAAAGSFTLSGTVQQIGPDEWLIEGMPVALDGQTSVAGAPQVGAAASVPGVIGDDGVLLARAIDVEAPALAPTTEPTRGPTAESTPTTAPTAEPTSLPPTAEPTPIPPPTEAAQAPPAGEPIAALRGLLQAGVADGRAGKDGQDLLNRLSEVEKELAEGKPKDAAKKLRELEKRVAELARKGEIDGAFAREVLAQIVAAGETPDFAGQPGNGGRRGDDND